MAAIRVLVALTLSALVAWSQDIDQIVHRIQEIAPQEFLARGIETELRPASLLRESRPDVAAAFLESGEATL